MAFAGPIVDYLSTDGASLQDPNFVLAYFPVNDRSWVMRCGYEITHISTSFLRGIVQVPPAKLPSLASGLSFLLLSSPSLPGSDTFRERYLSRRVARDGTEDRLHSGNPLQARLPGLQGFPCWLTLNSSLPTSCHLD